MSKSTNRVDYLGTAGLVQSASRGMWDFIYQTSTVKNAKYNIGDRVVLPDGREFRYAKSTEAIKSGLGCNFTAAGYISYTTITTAAAAGAISMTVPAATHATLTEDELAGGYICIFDNSTGATQFRQIVGNQAVAANLAFVIYLDGALTEAVTTADSCEVYQNPYAALETSDGGLASSPKAGLPATNVAAADTYFWVQVRGFSWTAPQGGKLGQKDNNVGLHGAFWSDYGNVSDVETSLGVTVANGRGSQYAGYVVEGDADNIGPLICLQG
jgi:hypothetical protein